MRRPGIFTNFTLESKGSGRVSIVKAEGMRKVIRHAPPTFS